MDPNALKNIKSTKRKSALASGKERREWKSSSRGGLGEGKMIPTANSSPSRLSPMQKGVYAGLQKAKRENRSYKSRGGRQYKSVLKIVEFRNPRRGPGAVKSSGKSESTRDGSSPSRACGGIEKVGQNDMVLKRQTLRKVVDTDQEKLLTRRPEEGNHTKSVLLIIWPWWCDNCSEGKDRRPTNRPSGTARR